MGAPDQNNLGMQTLLGLLNVLGTPDPKKAKFEWVSTSSNANTSFEDIRKQLKQRRKELERDREQQKAALDKIIEAASKTSAELQKVNQALQQIQTL